MKHSERFRGCNTRRFSHPDGLSSGSHIHGSRGHNREHGGGGPNRGFGRRGRAFDYGDLRLLILSMIGDQPRHGYELIKAIEEKFCGAYAPSPGVMYPALAMLEEMGLIALAEAESGRKSYAITDGGRAQITAERTRLDALLARMGQAASDGGGQRGAPAPILRAMENVKLALRLRMARGDVGEAEAHAVAAALDEAARAIEKNLKEPDMQSIATITTPQAARYLTQLCKHFEHKLPVSHGDGRGRIPFSIGDCLLSEEDGVLTLKADAPDEAALAQLENVIERHLVRFAFREDLAMAWHRG